jgi:hypothetical protein
MKRCVIVFVACLLIQSLGLFVSPTSAQDYSGYQVIQGTRVYTEIYESAGFARFSNSCGSQTITQQRLQAGAIPDSIIPCPRPKSGPTVITPSPITNCGGGRYCDGGSICTRDKRCLSRSSPRVCSNGSYCDAGYFCTKESKCLSTESQRYCGDGAYCDQGFVCDQSRPKGDRCVARVTNNGDTGNATTDRTDQPVRKEPFIVLVSTHTGRFFGYGVARSASIAKQEALSMCFAQRANTASNEEERAEECRLTVSIQGGCAALVKSHDMYYGPEEVYAVGLATDMNLKTAVNEAMNSCKSKGGKSCFVVPEAARCTDPTAEASRSTQSGSSGRPNQQSKKKKKASRFDSGTRNSKP